MAKLLLHSQTIAACTYHCCTKKEQNDQDIAARPYYCSMVKLLQHGQTIAARPNYFNITGNIPLQHGQIVLALPNY
jgi:hypothetical protein